jgi:hypothetical protein
MNKTEEREHPRNLTARQAARLAIQMHFDQGWQVIPADQGPVEGSFRLTGRGGGGVLVIRHDVWETVAAPWFLWVCNDDELATMRQGEDYYFFEKVQAAGFQTWRHDNVVAGHLKTVDVTRMVEGRIPIILKPVRKTGLTRVWVKQ